MIEFLAKFPILKRLIPSIGIRALKLFKKNRGYFKIGKINFYLDFMDPIDRQIIIYKKYENDQVLFFEDQMNKTSFDYFLDIGSNSGYYSFYFADKFKNLKIRAFEPNLEPFNKFETFTSSPIEYWWNSSFGSSILMSRLIEVTIIDSSP